MELFDFIVLAVLFILLPLIADLLDNLFPKSGIGRIAQESVGYVMVVFILFLCSASVYLWATVYLPFKLLEQTPSYMIPFHVILSVFLAFTGTLTYLRALEVEPGFLRRRAPPKVADTNSETSPQLTHKTNQHKRLCTFCK